MSDFFESDQVQHTIMELTRLQQILVVESPYLPIMDDKQKRAHLAILKEFLEKQKLFFFRISLSDDKEAIRMKKRLMDAAKMFGVDDEIDCMEAFFKKLDSTIQDIESSIET